MGNELSKKLIKKRSRSYLAKDFESFRSDLLRYAQTYFPDKIQDFSEAGMGGLLLDFAAMVSDSMCYYLDHQFNEVGWSTAIESKNLQRHIRNAGVEIVSASPSVVEVDFIIKTPAGANRQDPIHQNQVPINNVLPRVLQNTRLIASNGVTFILTEDLDFGEKDEEGRLIADLEYVNSTADADTAQFYVTRRGVCMSGDITTESFRISDEHIPFRELVLSNENVTEILQVSDSQGNHFYEVESLSQDIVYQGVLNVTEDREFVKQNLELIPAPRRFVKVVDATNRIATLRFGAGNAETLDDDIIPDPSELALPLYGKKIFKRFSIDPNSLLKTHTLGISPINTTLHVTYRYGGGMSHNVAQNSIRTIDRLEFKFPNPPENPTADHARYVQSSLSVVNQKIAMGGDAAPTLEQLRASIPMARTMQSRIVSKEDLLARIYTMPSRFGRVFRAGMRQNPYNRMAVDLHVLCRHSDGTLVTPSDSLKINLQKYLNDFRLISDVIEIYEALIVNLGVKFDVVCSPHVNKNVVIQNITSRLAELFKIENYQIDQPIIEADVMNVIINTENVIALTKLTFTHLVSWHDERKYSDAASFSLKNNRTKGMIIPPPGGIFEMKYPEHDIIGSAS